MNKTSGSSACDRRVSLDKDPSRIRRMFDTMAGRYDLLDRVFSFGLDRRWRIQAVRALGLRREGRAGELLDSAPGPVLDVATGTGELARAALDAASDTIVIGIDFSQEMLRLSQVKLASATFHPVAGDALRLPFRDAAFRAVMIAYGLRNTRDTRAALDEFHRVLRPNGRLMVLEFGIPSVQPLRAVFRFYFRSVMPRCAGWLGGQREAFSYLAASVEAYPGASDLARLIERHGFRHERTDSLTGGISHAVIARAVKPVKQDPVWGGPQQPSNSWVSHSFEMPA